MMNIGERVLHLWRQGASGILATALGALIVASVALPAFATEQGSREQNLDSTSINAAGNLPASNCPNLQGVWYGPGQVPPGYYKRPVAPFNCVPVPACPGNMAWDPAAER